MSKEKEVKVKKFSVELIEPHWGLVLNTLMELPYKIVSPMLTDIKQQIEAQKKDKGIADTSQE